jgi:ABC-2 type transport system permease protein
MRSHVILAVFKRNVSSYFSGMLGYLFIVVFVVSGAFLSFNQDFFADNLANLDQLSEQFPLLLLFIIPAITMTTWADEKKLGTDELLFTLPATDFEVILGKYFAVLFVYTVALLFSTTHAVVLEFYGNPDWGLILTTYLGYWFAGGALLAAGMFASVLTSSSTVAFVLGAVICAVPVFIDRIPGIDTFLETWLGITEPLGVKSQLQGFTSGKVTFSGIFYFVGLTSFFLYLNAVFIARRHWAGGKNASQMALHYAARVACLAVALLSFTYTLSVAGGDIDTTSEKLHTLSPTTRSILKEIDNEKPVTIQAFISPEVPQDYVPVRKELIDKLREYDQRGGANVQVRFVEVEPFSEAAEEATSLGIQPRQIQSEDGGRLSVEDVYMGVVITSGFDTIVVPFFDRGTPIEYELTRSIGTASEEERRTVGILSTDANVNGGFNQQSFQSLPKWQIVTELEKQYIVKDVSADSEITADVDVLIAVLPSSLTQPQMDNFVNYVKDGNPVLIFDDPVPVFSRGLEGAPLVPKPGAGGGMMGRPQPGPPKADGGNATSLLKALGIKWNVRESLFDLKNPHPRYAEVFPSELVFLNANSSAEQLNPNLSISSGLQQLIFFSSGVIERDPNTRNVYEELLFSRTESTGLNDWDDVTQRGMFGGLQYSPPSFHKADEEKHTLAALITPRKSKQDKDDSEDSADEEKTEKKKSGVHAIFVADMDMIHDVMFNIWQRQMYDLKLDNVPFVLNCVDYLAGDERFINLRKRQAKHRTLTELERRKKEFEEKRSEEVIEADEEAKKAVEDAQERLNTVLKEIQDEMQKGNVDVGAAQVRLQNATEAENRKLKQQEEEIERAKNERVRHVRIEAEQQIRKIENDVWKWAVMVPPLPAIILGIVVILMSIIKERRGIAKDRLR